MSSSSSILFALIIYAVLLLIHFYMIWASYSDQVCCHAPSQWLWTYGVVSLLQFLSFLVLRVTTSEVSFQMAWYSINQVRNVFDLGMFCYGIYALLSGWSCMIQVQTTGVVFTVAFAFSLIGFLGCNKKA
jgi:hypothetical protein